jgi:hypothetical protein
LVIATIILIPKSTNALSGCLDYGMAYEDLSGYCKCMNGYVWGYSFGKKYCISANQACIDDYGYGATADLAGTHYTRQ